MGGQVLASGEQEPTLSCAGSWWVELVVMTLPRVRRPGGLPDLASDSRIRFFSISMKGLTAQESQECRAISKDLGPLGWCRLPTPWLTWASSPKHP